MMKSSRSLRNRFQTLMTPKRFILAFSCSPNYSKPMSLDYSGHQRGNSDRDKSRRKL